MKDWWREHNLADVSLLTEALDTAKKTVLPDEKYILICNESIPRISMLFVSNMILRESINELYASVIHDTEAVAMVREYRKIVTQAIKRVCLHREK